MEIQGMNKSKILLVEDDESTGIAGKYAFEEWYDIIIAPTTAKALELLEKENFDLVLLDIIIKTESEEAGIDALKIINKKYPNIPVIMLSGTLSWFQQWNKLEQLGASGYLLKPYDRHQARDMIEKCLKGEQIRKNPLK